MRQRLASKFEWLRSLLASRSSRPNGPDLDCFVIHHARRSVLHVHVTEHPTAGWITQQLREAFAYDAVPRYLIFENDKKYGD